MYHCSNVYINVTRVLRYFFFINNIIKIAAAAPYKYILVLAVVLPFGSVYEHTFPEQVLGEGQVDVLHVVILQIPPTHVFPGGHTRTDEHGTGVATSIQVLSKHVCPCEQSDSCVQGGAHDLPVTVHMYSFAAVFNWQVCTSPLSQHDGVSGVPALQFPRSGHNRIPNSAHWT
jgi:hypothetical protein